MKNNFFIKIFLAISLLLNSVLTYILYQLILDYKKLQGNFEKLQYQQFQLLKQLQIEQERTSLDNILQGNLSEVGDIVVFLGIGLICCISIILFFGNRSIPSVPDLPEATSNINSNINTFPDLSAINSSLVEIIDKQKDLAKISAETSHNMSKITIDHVERALQIQKQHNHVLVEVYDRLASAINALLSAAQ